MARSEMTTITTKEAAELAGLLPASFRGEMTRERARGRDHRAPRDLWPDGRTPLWDESSIHTWLEGRARSDRESSVPVAEPEPDDDDLLFGANGDLLVGIDDPASERTSTLMDLSASLTSTIMAAEERLRSSTMRTNGWALRAVEAATRKTQKLAAHLDKLKRELEELA